MNRYPRPRKLAGLLAAAVLVLTAAGCSAQQSPGAPQQGSAPAPTTDRVVLAVDPPTAESNATRMLGQTTMFQVKPMYEYLIGFDAETGKFVPQLATEWSLEPDGSGYRFKLRKGVQFQKGNGEFTAKDVVFTWKDLTKEDSLHAEAPYYRTVVKAIDVVNDYEVVFRLNKGAANFIHGVSEAEPVMEIISEAAYQKQGEPAMQGEPTAGTGPYQYKERAQGEFIRFERTPSHWRAHPDFPEFEFRFMKEPSTRLAALLTGEIHIASLPEDLLQQAVKQGNRVITGRVAGPRTFLQFNCCFIKDTAKLEGWLYPDSPLMDVRVRRALGKAINVDELNKSFLNGKGEPMYHAHLHPTRPGWNPEWQSRFADEYGYDPAKAKALLAEAGYGPGNPLRTNIHVQSLPNLPSGADLIEAIATYWRQVGVEPTLVQMDNNERTARQRALGFSNDVFIAGTSSGELIGSNAYWTSIPPRNTGVEDPECDAILLKINEELDDRKKEPLWRQFGDCTYNKHFSIPLFWLPAEAVVNPNVVSDWVFPGAITGTWTHVENIKAWR